MHIKMHPRYALYYLKAHQTQKPHYKNVVIAEPNCFNILKIMKCFKECIYTYLLCIILGDDGRFSKKKL